MGCWQKILLLSLFMMFRCDPLSITTIGPEIESESAIETEPEAEPEPESEPEVEPESAAFGVEPFGPYSGLLFQPQPEPGNFGFAGFAEPEPGFRNFGFGRGFGGFAEPEPEIWG